MGTLYSTLYGAGPGKRPKDDPGWDAWRPTNYATEPRVPELGKRIVSRWLIFLGVPQTPLGDAPVGVTDSGVYSVVALKLVATCLLLEAGMETGMQFYEALVAFLSTPAVRAVATVVSIVSLAVSIWALRKTIQAVHVQSRDVAAEHARYLEDRWQELHALTLSSDDFATHAGQFFGLDKEAAKRDAALLMFLNIASVNFSQWRNNVVSHAVYDAHMTSIFCNFRGDQDHLMKLIDLVGYDPEFRDACRRYLARRCLGGGG